jgi:ATP-dependent Clp protease ATP-binding subunit ClpA
VFERFTERARQVVVLAQDEARTLGHGRIGTEHLLLGILREEGAAAQALTEAGLSLERARETVAALVGSDEEPSTGQIPFTPMAKHALELALREALSLGHSYIGTEHVLLGVLLQRSGTAACVLRDCSVDTSVIVTALGLEGQVDPAALRPDADARPDRPGDPIFGGRGIASRIRRGSARVSVSRSRSAGEREGMFTRFTDQARQVVVLAQDEARALKHDYIGTEHILLGLLREKEGLAARVLESLDITLEAAQAQVARIVGWGDEASGGQLPFTPRAKKVLELALREALSLGHTYIGTEHILLGLVRENAGVAARILLDFDADSEKVRDEVVRMLVGRGPEVARDRPRPEGSRVVLSAAVDDATGALSVRDLIDAVVRAKEAALSSGDFERAARLRNVERELVASVRRVQALLDEDAGPQGDPGA